jgi:uncharacterized protein YuzE
MKSKYDAEADAIYFYLSQKPYAYGIDLDNERRIDYASYNTPVGVELLCVSKGVNLYGLPHKDEIAKILEGNGIRTYTMEGYPVEWEVMFNVDLTSSSFTEKEEVTV